jgi:hypothetical protein
MIALQSGELGAELWEGAGAVGTRDQDRNDARQFALQALAQLNR